MSSPCRLRHDPWDPIWVVLILGLILGVSMLNAALPAEPDPPPEEPPVPGLRISLPCEIVEVYDGDTVTARVTIDIRVRLLDCWAPEIKTKNLKEKELGLASKAAAVQLAEKKKGTLTIPLDQAARLDDLFTFGRLLGDVWIEGEAASLADQLDRSGHAKRTKQELEAWLKTQGARPD